MRMTIVKSGLTAAWGMCLGITLSYGLATHGVGIDRADEDKPVNSPSWTTHQDAAREFCGGDVVEASSDIWATHVVVVKLNGLMVRMPIDEAFDRAESKSRADDIWTIGVCKSDTRPAPTDNTRDA